MTTFHYVVDNLGRNTADAILRYYIKPCSLCSVASAYFTVSGFELVATQLEQCKDFRLLLGAEPGADPLRMAILDIWKNIDIRDSPKQAERAVKFFSQDNVQIRLHGGPFFHGKTYILNHPEPAFDEQEAASSKEKSVDETSERQRPLTHTRRTRHANRHGRHTPQSHHKHARIRRIQKRHPHKAAVPPRQT